MFAISPGATLSQAISALNGGAGRLVVDRAVKLGILPRGKTRLEVPASVQLVFLESGSIVFESSFGLLLWAAPIAGPWQIFKSADTSLGNVPSGKVVFHARPERVLPEWWGAKAGSPYGTGGDFLGFVNAPAIQAAIDSVQVNEAKVPTGGEIRFSASAYWVQPGLTIPSGVSLVGCGSEATIINLGGAPPAGVVAGISVAKGASGVCLKDFRIRPDPSQARFGGDTTLDANIRITSGSDITLDGVESSHSKLGLLQDEGDGRATRLRIVRSNFLYNREAMRLRAADDVVIDHVNVTTNLELEGGLPRTLGITVGPLDNGGRPNGPPCRRVLIQDGRFDLWQNFAIRIGRGEAIRIVGNYFEPNHPLPADERPVIVVCAGALCGMGAEVGMNRYHDRYEGEGIPGGVSEHVRCTSVADLRLLKVHHSRGRFDAVSPDRPPPLGNPPPEVSDRKVRVQLGDVVLRGLPQVTSGIGWACSYLDKWSGDFWDWLAFGLVRDPRATRWAPFGDLYD